MEAFKLQSSSNDEYLPDPKLVTDDEGVKELVGRNLTSSFLMFLTAEGNMWLIIVRSLEVTCFILKPYVLWYDTIIRLKLVPIMETGSEFIICTCFKHYFKNITEYGLEIFD